MKALEVKTHEIELGGNVGESNDFSVKIDGHIFKLMTDGLYSAKVPSVVREILANAIDAQIQSGRKEAVRVSLPTAFNKNFRVRDYGNGMSHEFVMKLYTQLGHSTKRDDNTQTGFFGMGSKSPFTISDQFTVTVFDGKHKRVYSAFIAENGIPRLTNPLNVPSTEPSGVEVSVPVPNSYINEFEGAIKASAFAYFDKDIVFNRDFGSGDSPLDWAQKAFKKIADGVYTVRERSKYGSMSHGGSVYIRQGFAVYPFEVDSIIGRANLDRTTVGLLRRVSAKGTRVYLDAPLGTFNVTASREKIQYDEPSVANLGKLLTERMLAAAEHISAQVKGVWNYLDARHLLEQAYLKEYSVGEDGKPCVPDIKEVMTASNDLFDLFKPEIEKNYVAHFGIVPGTPPQADVRPLLTKFTIRENLIAPSAKFYTSSSSFYYSDVSNDVIGGASFSRSESLTWDVMDLTYVVPSVLKHWQERVYKHAAGVVKQRYGKFAGTYNCTIHVVRCNRADVPLACGMLMKHNTYIIGDITTEDKLPIYVPDATTASVTRRGYSKTAIYTARKSSSAYSWAWSKDKTEAPSDEPAYYVARVGIGSMVHFASNAKIAACNLARKPYATLSESSTFIPRDKLDNGTFFRLAAAAQEHGIIDADLPIYRLTENQRDKVRKDKDCEWIDITDVLIDSYIKLFEDKVVTAVSAPSTLLQNMSVARCLSTLIDEFFDLTKANDDIAISGDKFVEVNRRFMRNATVFGLSVLELPTLLKSDAFALAILPAYVRDDRSDVAKAHTKSTVIAEIKNAVQTAFRGVPALPEPKMKASLVVLQALVNDEFALLNDLNYLSNNRGKHVVRYLTSCVSESNVQSVKVADYPELVPLVDKLRNQVNTNVKTYLAHQRKAASNV